ncbi:MULTISPECIES: DUF1848 domain-containing protein [unclassified Dehalobacter]|uniref:DUF1848 domain-containing protein n=1 Tax=unclassified Dehalobacter TaxID=2635733 RepID=UPI000E6CECFA|nr:MULTISPECIES: DUF1848 domain-containing protein [unclassified Dehalobacter]RJE47179.1 hypothetical protein A7K50_04185 [Dehalobacter sp. MCB1]TCX53658.1 hypothetical protein C1I36_02655 [Dehalobacter sp. 14DCB1]TCX54961.1 hypothetical protein C1I38_04620 [Dehalobacter sp. 12DCB1]
MIISVSRRTDIPAFYAKWFYHRLKEKSVLVRNPMNIHLISKINLSPDVVDGIVFWTKNPAPMLERLDELRAYTYYFQFTLNPYGKDIEPNVPSKNDIVIPTFQKLSERIGKDKVIWRYDPILFNADYTTAYHLTFFKSLAAKLAGYTEKCTVSFLNFYQKTERNLRTCNIIQPTSDQKIELMQRFAETAKQFGMDMDTCAEDIDCGKFGIRQAHCIDKERFKRLGGYHLNVEKDKNQRPQCGCVTSVDIGAYNTCKNGCLYCYANFSLNAVQKNDAAHHPESPLLFGSVGENDAVKTRDLKSYRNCQFELF